MKYQSARKDRFRPSVVQHFVGGMWYAQVYSLDGKFITKSFFTHTEALAKAYELAAINRRAAK